MKHSIIAGLVFGIVMIVGCIRAEEQHVLPNDDYMAVFYVAVDGSDLNDGSEDAPFATLNRARDAVRIIRKKMTNDVLVAVEPGDYFMADPFVLTARDSGENGHQVHYLGLGDSGSARLIGGEQLTEWEPAGGGVFRAKVAEGRSFNTLYENGIRARKARFPNYEFNARFPLSGARYLTAADGRGSFISWEKGALGSISEVDFGDKANLVVWPFGHADWHKVTRRILEVDKDRPAVYVDDIKVAFGKHARFYIEGARGLLDQPGEFYLNEEEGVLYYWPRFGDPSKQEVIIPLTERIISLEGSHVDKPVHDVVIEGFTLCFTDTFSCMEGRTQFPWSVTSAGPHGTLHLLYTEDVSVRFNHIQGSGMNGIYLDRSNKRDLIYGNWIEDSGISGVVLAYHREFRLYRRDINEENRIENNLIHGLGSVAVDSAGVNIWGGRSNVVSHCEIFDGARYGVSLRGRYGQLKVSNPVRGMPDNGRPETASNRIEYSHFYRLGQDSGDMGVIHMSGMSSRTDHPVNTLEQLLIEDTRPHPSMRDLPANGVFFDYTEGVTDQVLRNVEIRSTRTPFRTNRTNIRHTFDNCSWLDGFDSSKMDYAQIGLLSDFPENFKSPRNVQRLHVVEKRERAQRRLMLHWENPDDSDYKGLWITGEGEASVLPVFVPRPQTSIELDRPEGDHLAMFRLQTVDAFGNRPVGVLIAAAQCPDEILVETKGVQDGIDLRWSPSASLVKALRVTLPGEAPVDVPFAAGHLQLDNLQEGRVYRIQVDPIDLDGHLWLGSEMYAAAGERLPPPLDVSAWWTLDDETVKEGKSIVDESGAGNTLFIGHSSVSTAEGRFGRALCFDGKSSFARVLDAASLEIGTGDYAVSLWIKPEPTTAMAGRVLDFGGGMQGAWEHWGSEAETMTPAAGLSLVANDYSMGALLHDGSRQYAVRSKGLDLPGAWHHVVINIERSGRMSLWLNGEALGSVSIASCSGKEIHHANTIFFAKQNQLDHENLFWSGRIDQVRIYHRSVSAVEISALFEEPTGH